MSKILILTRNKLLLNLFIILFLRLSNFSFSQKNNLYSIRKLILDNSITMVVKSSYFDTYSNYFFQNPSQVI